ncbi:MAG: hypothetical protein FWG87_08040 [Defluviitaleaceae bacterium]|nr:hypothetical protein [Defluviitaleaceae bacterium]
MEEWNADFRGFSGFSRILSGVFIRTRAIKLPRSLCFVSFSLKREKIRENPLNPRKSAFHALSVKTV